MVFLFSKKTSDFQASNIKWNRKVSSNLLITWDSKHSGVKIISILITNLLKNANLSISWTQKTINMKITPTSTNTITLVKVKSYWYNLILKRTFRNGILHVEIIGGKIHMLKFSVGLLRRMHQSTKWVHIIFPLVLLLALPPKKPIS